MEDILESLNQLPGVQASMIVDRDGLVILSSGRAQPDPDFVGATAAEYFVSLDTGMAEKLSMGQLDTASLEGTQGNLFLKGINEATCLVVLTRSKVNLGLVRYEIKHASERLREQL